MRKELLLVILLLVGCNQIIQGGGPRRIPVILDTDIGDDIDDTWALDARPSRYRVKPKEYIKCGDKVDIEGFGLYMLCQVGPDKGMLISQSDGNRYSDTIIELDKYKAAKEAVEAVVREIFHDLRFSVEKE